MRIAFLIGFVSATLTPSYDILTYFTHPHLTLPLEKLKFSDNECVVKNLKLRRNETKQIKHKTKKSRNQEKKSRNQEIKKSSNQAIKQSSNQGIKKEEKQVRLFSFKLSHLLMALIFQIQIGFYTIHTIDNIL